MKARVFVNLKSTVLDPQGQTIRTSLVNLGHAGIAQVRQGKVFDIEINAATPEHAREELGRIAHDILANPVIEEYRVELLD